MDMLALLLSLVMALDAAWGSWKGETFPLSASVAEPYIQEVFDTYVEVGAFSPGGPIDVKFGALPAHYWGGTYANRSMFCLRRIVLQSGMLRQSHPMYNTPEWLATLAHEEGHVFQGADCSRDRKKVESGADVGMYIVLAHMAQDDRFAKAALTYEMRRSAILALMDLLIQDGSDPAVILDHLDLTPKERNYFDWWLARPDYLHQIGNSYFSRSITTILTQEEGRYCQLNFGHTAARGKVCLDGSALNAYIDALLDREHRTPSEHLPQ